MKAFSIKGCIVYEKVFLLMTALISLWKPLFIDFIPGVKHLFFDKNIFLSTMLFYKKQMLLEKTSVYPPNHLFFDKAIFLQELFQNSSKRFVLPNGLFTYLYPCRAALKINLPGVLPAAVFSAVPLETENVYEVGQL